MTRSSTSPRRGSQLPRVDHYPEFTSTLGGPACELAALAGLKLDPWQQHVIDVALGVDELGQWSAFEVGVLVPRQNGKGAILEALGLAALFMLPDRLILHSAHEFKTAQEAFLRIKTLVEGSDTLRKRVKAIRNANGEEGIELLDGSRLRFVARSKSSGRGFSADRVILDEAQELPVVTMDALIPTLSARPNPQIIYTGTVPSLVNDSEVWTGVRNRGRKNSPGLAWLEWSPGEKWEDADDREAWYRSNPALGFRLTETYIERERESLTDDSFRRERLSIWDDAAQGVVIKPDDWEACEDPQSRELDDLAFGIDVAADRSAASIAMAGLRADGTMHVEVIENRGGIGWVPERVAQLVRDWEPIATMVDSIGTSGEMIPKLQALGVDVLAGNTKDATQGCGSFLTAVEDRQLFHIGQPGLNEAVAAARSRPVGPDGAWAWNRKDATDITPLVACTLAKRAYDLSLIPDEPKREKQISTAMYGWS